MSFIRRRRKGDFVYLEEVESVRVGDKVVQRFIRHVGREADGRTILSGSLSDVSVEAVKLCGPLMVLHALASALELPALLGEYANEILALTYAHCLDYKSLNQMQAWFERTDLNMLLGLEELTEKRLVSALDSLEGMDPMALERALFKNTQAFLGLKTQGVVYDVTNTYFHGRCCPLGRFGHDKEGRKGDPLIQIGLAVTAKEGVPICHKTFPGNIHDARTFVDISNELVQFGITHGLAVMDRGISSAENSGFLSSKRWQVLCGLKRSDAIETALGAQFSAQDLCQLKHRVPVQQAVFYAQALPFKHGHSRGRLIVCLNRKAAQDMQESRLSEVEAARKCLREGAAIKPELQEYFAKDGRVLETRLNQESRWDGLSFIFTTSGLTIPEIIKAYFDKDVAEKSFQTLKGVVRLRPVRHWLYNRVTAHVFICYLACLLLSLLKIKVAPLELSFQEAMRELDGLYRVYLRDTKSGFKLGRLVALTKQQEKILRAVDKRLLKKCSGEK
ncbi:MAG: IS1634 family transposase [Gammaproteobacteria bacterium]